MSRQIAYDPAQLRQDVMTLFWANGFSDTSLADLEEATGLNRRQLYNGIGDKHAMFLQALDDFTDLSIQDLLSPLETPTAGIADIATLFGQFVDSATMTDMPKGCLMCSTSQDDVAALPDVASRLNAFFDRIRAAHLNALTRAAERGEITLNDADRQRRADALFGAHVALCVLVRAGRSQDQLTHIATQALEGLT